MLGVSVGGRISELLALKINDVWQNRQPVSDLLFRKGAVKGKETSRMVPVNTDGQKAIREVIAWHKKRERELDPQRVLFISRQGGEALSRSQAHRILEAAFTQAGLNGKLATHSLRKTFAQRCFDACGDIYQVSELLGHKDVETTKRYIGISYTKLQETVKAISIEGNLSWKTLHSNIAEGFAAASGDSTAKDTEALILELQARGIEITEQEQLPKGKVIPFPKSQVG